MTERPQQAGNPRQLLLYAVGPFLGGTVAAYGPAEEGLKQLPSGWQPLTAGDRESLRQRIGHHGQPFTPCRTGAPQRGATRDGTGWVICPDRQVFLRRNDTFEPRGRAPANCTSGLPVYGAIIQNEELFLTCEGAVWRNRDLAWVHERTPEKVQGFASTHSCLYAIGDHSIMARC